MTPDVVIGWYDAEVLEEPAAVYADADDACVANRWAKAGNPPPPPLLLLLLDCGLLPPVDVGEYPPPAAVADPAPPPPPVPSSETTGKTKNNVNDER